MLQRFHTRGRLEILANFGGIPESRMFLASARRRNTEGKENGAKSFGCSCISRSGHRLKLWKKACSAQSLEYCSTVNWMFHEPLLGLEKDSLSTINRKSVLGL